MVNRDKPEEAGLKPFRRGSWPRVAPPPVKREPGKPPGIARVPVDQEPAKPCPEPPVADTTAGA